MGRVSLRKVTLCNFRSFVGETSVSFDDSGLVLLLGRSGSGKSSIFLAIAYALDFAPWSAKELKCWHTDDPMWVELELATDKGTVIVRRGDKPYVKISSEPKVTSAKGIAEALDKVLGLNKTLREALTFRRQRQPGMFLSKRDGEKKQFLVELLGLHWLEKEIDVSVGRVTSAKKLVDQMEPLLTKADDDLRYAEANAKGLEVIDVAPLEAEVEGCKADVEDKSGLVAFYTKKRDEAVEKERQLALRARNTNDEEIAKLKSENTALVAQQSAFVADDSELKKLEAFAAECKRRESRAEQVDKEKLSQFEANREAIRNAMKILTNELATVPSLHKELRRLQEEAHALEGQKCSKCLRQWAEAFENLTETRHQIALTKTRIEAIEANRSKVADMEKALAELRFEPDPKIAKMRELREQTERNHAVELHKLNDAKRTYAANIGMQLSANQTRIRTLELEAVERANAILQNPERPSLRHQKSLDEQSAKLQEAERNLNQALSDIQVARATNRERLARHDADLKLIQRARNERLQLAQKQHENLKLYAAERDYLEMLRGFLGQIFDEILREISDEANKIIGAIPNTASVSLKFTVERETAEGKLRNEITPIVSYAGKEAPLESGASGGMLTSIEVAVDLAVSRVIARRTGFDLGWLVLDESFTGHTVHEKESCLEVLREYAREKLILIVDHASEFKEMFSRIVEVQQSNGRSSISEAA
jgi:DNA repair exonuclease SbcCD ATPase subunit